MRALNAAIAVATFVLTCLTLHALRPSRIFPVTSKLAFYAEHREEFDTVFVGSSRIHRGISPKIFDDTTAASGIPTHSFNLGVAGMTPPESFFALQRLLQIKSRRLRWVFCEFDEVQNVYPPGQQRTQRLLNWHNWTLTSLVVRKTIGESAAGSPSKTVLGLLAARHTLALHLGLFARKMGNLGEAKALLRRSTRDLPPRPQDLGPALDGYQPKGGSLGSDKVAAYQERLAAAIAARAPRLVDRYSEAAFRLQAELVRSAGASPIFLVPPSISQDPVQFSSAANAPGPLFAFNDAAAYPALYKAEARRDDTHLSVAGADEFTKTLAQEFAAQLRAGEIR